MKLLFMAYDYPGYYGGPIVKIRRLLPELQRRGHDVHCLVLYREASPAAEFLEENGVRCILHPRDEYTERLTRWTLHCLAAIRPDVFVPNMLACGLFAARWAREAGIPTIGVHYSHDDFNWAIVDQFVAGAPEWAVSGLVCYSDELMKETERRGHARTKLCTIPSGIFICEEQSAQEGPLRLVYVGRLVQKQKRIHDLVDALAAALQRHPAMTATLIGTGSEEEAVRERIARHGLAGRIRLAGTIPAEQIQRELVNHHVIVLLSDFEGMPGALLDGMAAGLVPVCLEAPGGLRELVIHERTGLLVTDRGGSFLDALDRLAASDDLRRRLAANARALVFERYSVTGMTDRWEKFCRQLLDEAGPRRPLKLPRRLGLPPVQPGLARADRRGSPFARMKRWLARARAALKGAPAPDTGGS